MIDPIKLHKEFKLAKIPIVSVSETGKIETWRELTKEEKSIADSIVINHVPSEQYVSNLNMLITDGEKVMPIVYVIYKVVDIKPEPEPEAPKTIEFDLPLVAPDFIVSSLKISGDKNRALEEAIEESKKQVKSIALIVLSLTKYFEDIESRLSKLEKKLG